MMLTADRAEDGMHSRDLIAVELIDTLWLAKSPPILANRLKHILIRPTANRNLTTMENPIVPFIAQTEAPPLREDAAGAVRVGNSRVLLELVVRAFQDGATPETILQRYSTLKLSDVYAVIAYYLRHRTEIEEYLARRETLAAEVRQRVESQHGDLSEIRGRLQTQRQSRG